MERTFWCPQWTKKTAVVDGDCLSWMIMSLDRTMALKGNSTFLVVSLFACGLQRLEPKDDVSEACKLAALFASSDVRSAFCVPRHLA